MNQVVYLYSEEDNRNVMSHSFTDDLIVPPNAKISFLNCNLRFNEAVTGEQYNVVGSTVSYVINGQNSTVTMLEDYNTRNGFLKALVDRLNYDNASDDYLDWNYNLGTDGKITFNLANVNFEGADLDNDGRKSGKWEVISGDEATAFGNTKARYLSKYNLSRGQWLLTGVYEATNSDFYFGAIRETDTISSASTFTGVFIDNLIGNALVYFNNVEIDNTNYTVQQDDAILLQYVNGILNVQIVDSNGVEQYGEQFNLENEIGGNQLLGYEYRLYLHNVGNGTNAFNGGIAGLTLTEVKDVTIKASSVTLNISQTLARYLGFNELTLNRSNQTGKPIIINSDNAVAGDKSSSGIMVLFSGVGMVGSYEGVAKGESGGGFRSNAIANIPETANLVGTNDVYYEAPYRYELALNNTSQIRVNKLELRYRTRQQAVPLQLRSGSVAAIMFS